MNWAVAGKKTRVDYRGLYYPVFFGKNKNPSGEILLISLRRRDDTGEHCSTGNPVDQPVEGVPSWT
jgi:hypothetical protein